LRPAALVLLAVGAAACSAPAVPPSPAGTTTVVVAPVVSPATPGSAEPQLSADVLSWVERRAEGGHRLRFARWTSSGWSTPLTVAEGDRWFVNWADFPSVVPLEGGALAAHWLAKSGEGAYAYDVKLSRSQDGGRTWSAPVVPHRDGVQAEHGFVTLLPAPGGAADVVWLDGRAMSGGDHGGGATALRTATFSADGKVGEERVLDPRVCDCCQTGAVRVAGSRLVVYRDRGADEVRDISAVREAGGQWSEPETPGADRWTIPGCPVNGPAVAAEGNDVALAWYGAPGDKPHVKLRRSPDGGRTWGEPVRVDEGQPLGRVDVVALPGGSALVSWLERRTSGSEILVRLVPATGPPGPPVAVARTSEARASGFPRLERAGEAILMAWTEAGEPSRISTARLVLR
jgi:hypothetical protein